jgi:putative ABC transport system substrate-binding protein
VGPHTANDPSRYVTDVPVVFTMVAAPVLANIVPALDSSRRNLTGVYIVAPTEAQLKAIASYRPIKTLAMIYTPTEQNSVVVLDEVRQLSRKMGFGVIARPFKLDAARKVTNEGAADMVREMKQQGADWLYLPPDSYLNTQTKSLIIPAAMEVGLPTFASTEGLMETGALMGLVARYHSIGQFTAYKAEQILVQKVPPARIPVETLTRFSLQVRMDVARALNLPPPLPMFNYSELITRKAGQ